MRPTRPTDAGNARLRRGTAAKLGRFGGDLRPSASLTAWTLASAEVLAWRAFGGL